MTTYHYTGTTSSGAKVEGVVRAFDKQDAVIRAKEHCRVVLRVEPVSGGKLHDILHVDMGSLLSGGKIRSKTLAMLCSQLAIEIKAGLPLVAALKLVAENEPDKTMKRILEEVAEDVQAGNGLADAFELRGPGLPRTFIETIRAGEESGRLDEIFERLQTFYVNADSIASKVGSALIYPAMLISVAVVVVSIIMIYAVPVFAKSFASRGNPIPIPTKILIQISNFMVQNWLILLFGLLGLIFAAIVYGRTDRGAHMYARLALRFPGIGAVNRMNAASQFSATLCTMLSAGLPLVLSGNITAATTTNILVREEIEKAINGVTEGNSLAEGLRQSSWLPVLMKEMITVGEETGKMEETLNVVSEYYTREVDMAVKRALDVLNPCITLVLALIVLFILLSVYLPIFAMY